MLVELEDPENPRISYTVAKYARYLQREGHASYESIRKSVLAIGKLRDYYILVYQRRDLNAGDMKTLLEDFLFDYDHGSVLGWKSATNNDYLVARNAIADYVQFLCTLTSGLTLDKAEYQFIDECRRAYVNASRAHESLLFHTKKRAFKKRGGRKKNAIGLRQYKPFPPHLIDELIQETENIRDKLLLACAAFGGRRISEYLNLFLEDVEVIGIEFNMTLRHPMQASMSWRNIAGSKVSGTRREYLKSMFNLTPRPDHGAQSSKAGWKGILFENEAAKSASVYFIRDSRQELAKLHRRYIHEFLPRVKKGNHPYYFVSEEGKPLTVKAAENLFKLACKRLEKKHGISLRGYGFHSLRHYYGFFHADVLKTDLLLIRQYMGHINLSSTAVYAHISPETARKALALAEDRAKHEGRIEMGPHERERIQQLFADCPVPRLALDLERYGRTAYGNVDTGKIRRKFL